MSESRRLQIVSWVIVIAATTSALWHPRPETVHVDTMMIIAAIGVCTSAILKALGK